MYLAPELRKPTEEILASWFAEEPGPESYAAPRAGTSKAAESRPKPPDRAAPGRVARARAVASYPTKPKGARKTKDRPAR